MGNSQFRASRSVIARPLFDKEPTNPRLNYFLVQVAKGNQDEAESLLTSAPENAQILLRSSAKFPDYSKRIFDCTAYEYAFWAKDTHMCKMLQRHMDLETRTLILMKIREILRSGIGLVYQQNGRKFQSMHFNFTPIIMAYQELLKCAAPDVWNKRERAWRDIGQAQRDLPAHVAQEFCRKDRSFYPAPDFSDTLFPRKLRFYNNRRDADNKYHWFSSDLPDYRVGFEFALYRASSDKARIGWEPYNPHTHSGFCMSEECVSMDLSAITFLDEVRTQEINLELLMLSRGPSLRELFLKFQKAAANNDIQALSRYKLEAPDLFQKLITSGVYLPFRMAAENGQILALEWFKKHAPEQIQAMISSFNYMAFQKAARKNHLDVLIWLAENAPSKLQQMIMAENYEAIKSAAANGSLIILNWLKTNGAHHFNAKSEVLFDLAAKNGHLDTLIWLKANVPDAWQAIILAELNEMSYMLQTNVFTFAAMNGHLDILKWLKAEDPAIVRNLFSSFFTCDPFCQAASNGHLPVLKWLKNEADIKLEWDYLKGCIFEAFELAAANGHLDTLKWLKEVAPDEFKKMIKSNTYMPFYLAAKKGHLPILEWLISEAPMQWESMVIAEDSRALKVAQAKGHLLVVDFLRQAEEFIQFAPSHNQYDDNVEIESPTEARQKIYLGFFKDNKTTRERSISCPAILSRMI